MQDTKDEEKSVLSLDSGDVLRGIKQALEAYARTIPNAVLSRITFKLEPDSEADVDLGDDDWRVSVTLLGFGDLRSKDASTEDRSFLAGAAPVKTLEQQWSATGKGYARAVEELRNTVDRFLQHRIHQCQSDLVHTNEALRVLHVPNELDVWAETDNPQDDEEHEDEEEHEEP